MVDSGSDNSQRVKNEESRISQKKDQPLGWSKGAWCATGRDYGVIIVHYALGFAHNNQCLLN